MKTFQLERGDYRFAGSDGRDDIVICEDNDGNRIINEDETMILKHIENAKADLKGTFNSILQSGEQFDDFSLVRIGFQVDSLVDEDRKEDDSFHIKRLVKQTRADAENERYDKAIEELEEANKVDDRKPDLIRELVRIYIKTKDYQKAVEHADDYIFLRPADTEMIYIASYCYKLLRKFEKAADLGERVRLREPEKVKYLVNLADIYANSGNFHRAKEMITKAAELDQDNEKIIRIKQLIDSKLVQN